MSRVRTLKTSMSVFLALISFIVNAAAPANAAMPISARDIKSINRREFYRDSEQVTCSAASVTSANSSVMEPVAAGSKLYVLGDSITVGMRDAGSLEPKLVGKGWVVNKINAIGGKMLEWGDEQITADSEIIADSDVVVVGLGTNNIGDVVSSGATTIKEDALRTVTERVSKIVANIKAINSDAKIYWTNVYIRGTLTTSYGSFNMDLAMPPINLAIENVAQLNNVSVIPWATSQDAVSLVSSDGIHPSGKYPEMADFVVGQLSGAGASSSGPVSAAGCTCSVGSPITTVAPVEERYQNTWSYFVTTKQLKPEAAAGLMGNLDAESGINPWNVQNSATGIPDGPEIPIDAVTSDGKPFRNSYGYGIAQWTSGGRQQKLIDLAAQTNRSTGDLGLQLDFLWQELTESYTSVLAVLQTSNVTLEGASDEVVAHFETPLPFTDKGTEAQRQEAYSARRAKSGAIFNTYSGKPPGSFTSSSCAGSVGEVVIDLESIDTTATQCAPGTLDKGPADAYSSGKEYTIRVCAVDGFTVNSQISGPIKSLLSKAVADGVGLQGQAPGFRTMDDQIAVYKFWCGKDAIPMTQPPYPKAKWEDNTSCPGGAAPGYSNHQMGLAIDFNCDGRGIPMDYEDAKVNTCFIWLSEHAKDYGLFEYSKGADRADIGSYEGWHWSVDGN